VDNELERKSNGLLKLLNENKILKANHDDLLTQTLTQIKSRETNLENFLKQNEMENNDNKIGIDNILGKNFFD